MPEPITPNPDQTPRADRPTAPEVIYGDPELARLQGYHDMIGQFERDFPNATDDEYLRAVLFARDTVNKIASEVDS